MKSNITLQKQDIIQWVSTLNDPIILSKLSQIKADKEQLFDAEFNQCISVDELKKKTTEFIQSLPWKKQ